MKNLKIRQKFLILGVSVFISLAFLGVLALRINNQSISNLNEVVQNFKETDLIQTSYVDDLFTLREITLSLVVSPNADFKNDIDKRFFPIIKKLDKEFSKQSLDNKKVWENYKKLVLKTRQYSLKGFDEGAFVNTTTVERQNFYYLLNNLKQIQSKKLEKSEMKLQQMQEKFLINNYYIVFSIILISLLGLLLDISIIRVVVKQIEAVEKGLKNFFQYLKNPSEYQKPIHIDIKSDDELGLMSKAINTKVQSIKQNLNYDNELIFEATTALKQLKQGKFGNRLSKQANSKELNVLKNVMNEMISNLEQKIKEETNQRTNQEKLMLQQSKLAAMGEMVGNIAHQWRQPIAEISAILMELEAMVKYDKLDEKHLLTSINTCNLVTQHMSSTISDFQNFYKPTKNKVDFSILQACKKAISIISGSLKNNNIELIFNINKDNIINGYPSEFSHAILNIISNAKDILVLRKIKNPKITLSINVGKKYTIVKIQDNAKGINPKNIDSIFEPYFTTKHAKQGTGIGLYMTKMIIENNMQGFVKAANDENGAIFTIKVK